MIGDRSKLLQSDQSVMEFCATIGKLLRDFNKLSPTNKLHALEMVDVYKGKMEASLEEDLENGGE